MADTQFELISFKTCPYVQRSRITLLHKDVEHSVTYIDLQDPPTWFQEVSPLGKVPVLRVHDGDKITDLFESAVINEYLDEVTDGSMLPSDPLDKAQARAWVEFASEMNMFFFQMVTAHDESVFEEKLAGLTRLVDRLEQEKGPDRFWAGDALGLVDTSFAPILQRIRLLAGAVGIVDPAQHPRIAAWTDALLSEPAVEKSVVPEFAELQTKMLHDFGGVAAKRVATV